MKNTFSRTGKQPKHATCSVLLWGNITHSTFRVHFDISPAATSSKNMCIPGLKYVWATHIRSLQAEGLYITEHINWVLTVVQDLCLVFHSVEIFWLWQLKGQIQIILIPINPFSDPSCPIWKRLQFLHFFFFFFFFLLLFVRFSHKLQPQVILLGKYPSGPLLGSAQSQLWNPLHSGKSIFYEFH